MSGRIRKRMSGDRRRGSLQNLVRTRIGNAGLRDVVLPVSCYRFVSVVGPQPPVGFEDTSWARRNANSMANQALAWRVFFDYGAAPTYVTAERPHNFWVRKMAPIRFRIDSLLEQFSGFGFSNIRNQFENDVNLIGHSRLTPPKASHLRGLQVTAASFPLRGIFYHAYSTNLGWFTGVGVTHYRILVDGVDQTGVVELTSPWLLRTLAGGVPTISTGTPTPFLPVKAGPDQRVEIDYWVQIVTGGGPFETASVGLDWPLCNIDDVSAFARAEIKANVRQVRGTYRLTFSDGGPQPSIVLTDQPGWTFSSSTFAQTLENGEWSITLDWSREYAQVRLVSASRYNVPPGSASRMKYYPVNTGHYDGVEFQNGYIAKPGVWNSQGATVFSLRQRQVQPVNWSSLNPTENGGIPASFFTGFPTSITVERV